MSSSFDEPSEDADEDASDDSFGQELPVDFYLNLRRHLVIVAKWATNHFSVPQVDFDDVAQDAALKIYKYIENGMYSAEDALKAASTIVVRVVLSYRRNDLTYQRIIRHSQRQGWCEYDRQCVLENIDDLLVELDQLERLVFDMRLSGLTIIEVAEQLDCSRSKVAGICAKLNQLLANRGLVKGAQK